MQLENQLLEFWKSYQPLLDLLRSSEENIPESRLKEIFENLKVFDGWDITTLDQLKELYAEQVEFKEEDSKDSISEARILDMMAESNKRVKWMRDLSKVLNWDLPYVTSSGDIENYPKESYTVAYVNISFDESIIRFAPSSDQNKGAMFFLKPIDLKIERKNMSGCSMLYDSSPHGTLALDSYEMSGWYDSTRLRLLREKQGDLKMERYFAKMRGEELLPFPSTESALEFNLESVSEKRNVVQIRIIPFDIGRLGEGEIDSFLKHIGYIR